MSDASEPTISEMLPLVREEYSALLRREYIRQHAPTILAGIAASFTTHNLDWDLGRERAIIQAGLLFDETEPK